MTDLNTAKINSLTQNVQQLRVRLDGISTKMGAFSSLICKIEGRLAALEDAENYRQQDEDVERAFEPVAAISLAGREDKPPLWQVLDQAETDLLTKELEACISYPDPKHEAVRIRALIEWLLPEEEAPSLCERKNNPGWLYRFDERRLLRESLLAEAEKAENH